MGTDSAKGGGPCRQTTKATAPRPRATAPPLGQLMGQRGPTTRLRRTRSATALPPLGKVALRLLGNVASSEAEGGRPALPRGRDFLPTVVFPPERVLVDFAVRPDAALPEVDLRWLRRRVATRAAHRLVFARGRPPRAPALAVSGSPPDGAVGAAFSPTGRKQGASRRSRAHTARSNDPSAQSCACAPPPRHV